MQKEIGTGLVDTFGVHNVCVYCGSSKGRRKVYGAAARELGRALAQNGIGLVYGGGSLGLMGELAKAALKYGGRVTGIIPGFLTAKEKMLRTADELIVTDDMHQRKMLMFQRADAFVALPGGIGTLEELVEQLSWAQLGRHTKPVVVANIEGFWTPFLSLLDHMRGDNFIHSKLDVPYTVVEQAAEIVPAVLSRAAAQNGRSIDPEIVSKL